MKQSLKILQLVCMLILLNTPFILAQKKPVVKSAAKPTSKPVAGHNSNATVTQTFSNGIKLNIKGFKVSAAALYFDNDARVPEDNTVALEERINLLITIESGWKLEGEKAFPGGSEIIKLSTGAVVLTSDDLFKSYEETGVSPGDAKYITLKAIITKLDDKKKYIIVTFRVWDKKGPGEITGSYKFYIKK